MDQYFVVELTNVTDAAEQWVSRAAFDHGALGLYEPLEFEQPEGEESVTTRIPERRSLQVYFEFPPASALLEGLAARYPSVVTVVRSEASRDWLEEWKRSFRPFPLAGGHWVVPSWCSAPAEAVHSLFIDPGMAFGTGTHETTQLMAEELCGLLAGSRPPSLLDVGTGTGILAMLARQLGVKRVVATDIESEARRVARENFARNGCGDVALSDRQLEDLSERFSIVAANIIDGVLLRLREKLLARVAPGGWLVVSGVIREREGEFLSGFDLPGGRDWDVRRERGDWLLFAVNL